MHPRKRRHRPTSKLNTTFINQVVEELRSDPSKISIIQDNLEQYRAQTHLKRGFLLAIERFDWVFEASKDIDFICQQILADDYIGNRLRRYPLLFKGVINNADLPKPSALKR